PPPEALLSLEEAGEGRSVHGLLLMSFEGGESVVRRLVVELQLAVFAAEVVGRAFVPDHPVCVVRIHGFLAHRVNRHYAASLISSKTRTNMKASPWTMAGCLLGTTGPVQRFRAQSRRPLRKSSACGTR